VRYGAAPALGWHDLQVTGDRASPAVRVRCYLPALARRGVLVWAHGGSWLAGSIEAWHQPCEALALACGRTVLSVDYRLAPRWPYPAPLDDVLRVLRWAAARFALGPGTPQLLVGGDSAGATLAASAAIRCRDEGIPLAAQILAYPPLDPTCSLPSYLNDPGAFPNRQALLDAWSGYRGAGEARYLTPWTIGDLRSLPPTLIGVGECDPVIDDCRFFGVRLQEHGNQVAFRSFPGAAHGLFFHQRPDGSFPLQEWIAARLPLVSNQHPNAARTE
jgi:acetyl esterase